MEENITTKFDIGDEVFFRSQGQICSGIVTHMQVTFVKNGHGKIYVNTIYRLKNSRGERYFEDFWEHRLHATKEELTTKSI